MLTEWALLQPLWLLALPVLLLIYILLLTRQASTSANTSQAAIVDDHALAVLHPFSASLQQQSANPAQQHGQLFIHSLIASLLLLALAQPVHYGATAPAQPEPVDLTLIIDTSVSMFLKDYQIQGQAVDRMSMTQSLLDRFATRFKGRRMGIIVFGDKAYHWLKPSEDRRLVRHLLARLQTSMAGLQSAIGDSLQVASAAYIYSNDADKIADNNKKVAVLITDAVRPGGQLSPQQGAQLAAAAGMTVYTIAIGSSADDKNRDNFGRLLYEPANIDLLHTIASITGGESFHATSAEAMDQALRKIEAGHRSTATQKDNRLQQALYIWPLALAILLLVWIQLRPLLRDPA